MKTIYCVFDRISPRHHWQIVGIGDDLGWYNMILFAQMKNYHEWNKKEEFPGFQVGLIKIENTDCNDIPDSIKNGEIGNGKGFNIEVVYDHGTADCKKCANR